MQAALDRSYCPKCSAVFRTPFSRCPLDGSKLAELADDPLVGSTLDQRYIIEECIGEGGMGRVYRAKHTRMSRTYAIKVLFGDHAGDTRMRSRFAREAEAVSRLNHVNVISVLDFGETKEGLLFLVMDLAPGPSLASLVHKQAPFTQARAIDILTQLSRGLAHAHGQGLVHRDFKCENVIMVIEEEIEVPKIVDFGICMIVEDSPSQSMLTSNGMIMGTPAVMAPEQASGDKVDHRTDLFSLGIVGYQMLSGCLPFEGTPLDMARKNLYEPIPSIAARSGVQVAPEVEAIIAGLTAKKPDDRFQSAKDVLRALEGLYHPKPHFSPGDSNEWPPTPNPEQHGHPQSVGLTPQARAGANHGRVPTGDDFSLQTNSSTPMVTQMPTSGTAKKKHSASVLLVGALAAIAAGVLAVLMLGSDGGKSGTSKSVAVGTPETTATADAAPTTAPLANVVDATPATIDAGSAAIDPEKVPVVVEQTLPPETNDTHTNKKSGRKSGRKSGKNSGKNIEVAPAPTPADLLKETLALWSSVNTDLNTLEKAKGADEVADLRAKFNRIDRSQILYTPSTRPIHDKSLRKLRAQIRARMNN